MALVENGALTAADVAAIKDIMAVQVIAVTPLKTE